MAKIVIREMMIILLICLANILILGVLLYKYVPSNKIIPETVSYTTPETVQEELSKSENVENDEIILTYSVNSTDLDNYERINTYIPGKANPFSSYDTSTSSNEEITQSDNSMPTDENTTSENVTQTDKSEQSTDRNTNSENTTQTSENTNTESSKGTSSNHLSNNATFYPDTGIK